MPGAGGITCGGGDDGGGSGRPAPLFGDPCDFDSSGPCCESPILIDLDGGGFRLTSVNNAVAFDLNSDGLPELISWTEAHSKTAFLALDRNGNGAIDTGRELFGSHTLLPTGEEATNGCRALAAYDSPQLGGNGDGFIDEHDAVYPSLRVWVDLNRNGYSEASELMCLDEAGVTRISLSYVETRRTDRCGNKFKYKGSAWVRDRRGHEHPVDTWDVFFVKAE